MRSALLTLLAPALLLPACAMDAPGAPLEETEDPLTIKADANGITLIRSLPEVLDSEKARAVDDAFAIVTDKLATAYPNEGIPNAADETRRNVDFGKMFTDGSALLRSRLHQMADYGIAWTDVVPSGFFFTAGGRFTANLHVGGGGQVTAVFVIIPQKISQVNRTDRTVRSFWRFSLGLTFIGLGEIGAGEGAGGAARFGGGLIWGAMDDASQFKGALAGVSASFALGVGNDFKLLLLKRDATAVVNNVIFMAEWQAGPMAAADFHGAAGVAIPLAGMLDQIGLGSGQVDGPTRIESTP